MGRCPDFFPKVFSRTFRGGDARVYGFHVEPLVTRDASGSTSFISGPVRG
jgi:hypothetical protein